MSKKQGGCCGGDSNKSDGGVSPSIVEGNNTDNRNKLEKGVKLVLLGDMNTGKTCIASRLVRNEFVPTDSTIGAAFLVKNMTLDNGNTVKLEIWDTAGQERYRSLTPMYYRGASAAVIVYDITKKNTFETLKRWVSELQKQASPNLILALAGNKADLPHREVQVDEVSKYISELGDVIFFETSAQTGFNVNELFTEICKKITSKVVNSIDRWIDGQIDNDNHSFGLLAEYDNVFNTKAIMIQNVLIKNFDINQINSIPPPTFSDYIRNKIHNETTNQNYPTLNHDDHVLMEAASTHFSCSVVVWNDKSVDWSLYDCLVIRSLWDYVHKFEEFQQWMKKIESMPKIKLLNPTSLIRWNWNKVYLKEMNELGGIDTIPTVYVTQGDICQTRKTIRDFIELGFEKRIFPETQTHFVIKPTIGANGYGTYRFTLDTWTQYQSEFESLLKESQMMIQPFVESVLTQGEFSYLYFNGKFSHSIVKKPCKNDFRVQEDHGGSVQINTPSSSDIQISQKVIDYISKQITKPLYARVDMLLYNGKLCLGECELFEPTLYFMKDSKIADRFFVALLENYTAAVAASNMTTITVSAAPSHMAASTSLKHKISINLSPLISPRALSSFDNTSSSSNAPGNASPRNVTPLSPSARGLMMNLGGVERVTQLEISTN
ncbi:hypothetical protein DFA_04763 [Cavenderia fasciculata]|uniref:Prokaryotic glutathione synthetase ATP-binding domain-containing protein n=1 Tax=Cavenderia fasciculata TaxID=261658 RepID=F4PQH0_CACFS|nr:uncharacterized protein DFA_04763 [Cavenderia fasciculata]EGG22633.1 hypothetical protein DFA_04763 [Cavenderia fasciculata]|eukprot:XP_004360484.1 hypothetical protein DFA_04763 [Cavenderia fasciculata]